MLPVQVKSVASSSCTLSEASALLLRFLSSDACSDSFARDYVANVVQALQDSKSGRSGGSDSTGNTAPSLPNSKLHSHGKKNLLMGLGDAHTNEKQSFPSAEDADACIDVRSVTPKAEHAFERHTKKRRRSTVENGLETDLLSISETEDAALMHLDKKRRKKQKHKAETETETKELYGPDDRRHHDIKRGKEMETKPVETNHPALDSQSSDGKTKKKKEKQGKDLENMETQHVLKNTGSPVSLSQAKRKEEVSHMDIHNDRVSVMPIEGTVEELAGSLRRTRREGEMFPSATLSSGKEREGTGMEALPSDFENLSSAKKKTKKRRRRKEGEIVRQL